MSQTLDRLLALNVVGSDVSYEYDAIDGVLSVVLHASQGGRWSVVVSERELDEYLSDYGRTLGDEGLSGFTLFTVDVEENLLTGRDPFAELRDYLRSTRDS